MKLHMLLIAILISLVHTGNALGNGKITPDYLRCEYKVNPLGIDVKKPRLSWELYSDQANQHQSAYQIMVASSLEKLNKGQADLWDTGKVLSEQTNQLPYSGEELISRQDCYWKVRVWNSEDEVSAWSEPAHWSMGLMQYTDWKGTWITHRTGVNQKHKYKELYLPPARYFRKSFSSDKKVKKAKAYFTSAGLFELRLNGEKVGEDHFTPGWTDYDKRIYYVTYDVTEQLNKGGNVIGATVADGWYAGYLGFALLIGNERVRGFYGVDPAVFGQLEIEYEDGTMDIIATDATWQANQGPIREADILMGEAYDARLEMPGWDGPDYDAENWSASRLSFPPDGKLEAYPAEPVGHIEEIQPMDITEPEAGVYVFDLGKNFAGVARLKAQGKSGQKITLRYGEMLHDDGTLMTENLRRARATDTYVLKGVGVEEWTPKFTYHGFRYVEVSGLSEKPDKEAITGIVMNSPTPKTSTFHAANDMNNTLYENILTTQFANFFEVPTDCPQRDERLGWTGDAQIYVRSAAYNADVAAFFTKWLVDLDDAQRAYGAYPNYAPFPYSRSDQFSPGWMDAGVIVPHTLYKMYGDTRIIERMYAGMKRFMAFQLETSKNYLRPASRLNFGDWLAVGRQVSDDFIAAAYFGHDARLMSEMAKAIGKEGDADDYAQLFDHIKKAFIEKYIDKDGIIRDDDNQTAYALALCFDLYPEHLAAKGAARLASMIQANGNVFSTGFLGTKHVMLALSANGYPDLAYDLFMQTDYPSWGYSIENGSTSIWERWNSYTREDGFGGGSGNNARMNSFSHYAFGAVAEWMFRYGLGIDTEGAGFRNIIIRPQINHRMKAMKGSYRSINGKIASGWKIEDGKLLMEIEIPVNTKAKVYIPDVGENIIRVDGVPLGKVDDLKVLSEGSGYTVLEAGSGKYVFTCE
ncbi:Bacterial alpha-L-rhamnosidase [Echinicola soli]|uniref:alpha-L-rhamnosidase n=1 Tax=Echinicola soli TaxID=2591634 RepID=A0A514CNB0_9BACT|nr:alpha-L-rhamnosidase [Echinicola soli]QDH81299.1 Bacterial alpha-L-rhamnosidase [Echinicola soli]